MNKPIPLSTPIALPAINTNLILSRRKDETIVIGDDIRVTVVKVKGSSVATIAVSAPPGVQVDREEVVERREAEFRQWFLEFKRIARVELGFNQSALDSIDEKAHRESHYAAGLSPREAWAEEASCA